MVEGQTPELFNGKKPSKSREFGLATILASRLKVLTRRGDDRRDSQICQFYWLSFSIAYRNGEPEPGFFHHRLEVLISCKTRQIVKDIDTSNTLSYTLNHGALGLSMG